MGQYTMRRLLGLIPTLLAVYTITFFLIHTTPGGPWDSDKPLPPEAKAALDKAYGLDKPLWRQYTDYLVNVFRGDFGPSFAQRNRDVSDIIKDFFPVSIKLGVVAIIIAGVVGVLAGTVSAVKQNTPLDYFATFGAILGISTPSYVVASLLILLLATTLHLLPTGGWNGIFDKRAIIP
ncbi:MAG TPA: ABC transporter permease, partial [Thermomicrobiales bacterium]